LRLPDGLDTAGFLATHWQKSPLFMSAAIDAIEPALTADELAWLATLPDVESRLVFTERDGARIRYRVAHGPFDDDALMALPDNDWTLLVQDVDKHLPDFRSLFRHVAFMPDWRIDDLMVSCAAPGGSVGPHRDHYDVFLCQGRGRREWRLADADKVSPATGNEGLSLLEPFAAEQLFVAGETDVLYLPPGIPHWGVALDRCVTYSIGMRAPEWCEFVCTCNRLFPKRQLNARSAAGPILLYEDPDLLPEEATPGLISASALRRARARFPTGDGFSDSEFATVFGSLVTDPKAWLAPEHVTAGEARARVRELRAPAELLVHGMARLAFTQPVAGSGGEALVFANGFHRNCDVALLEAAAMLCRERRLDGASMAQWQQEPGHRDLLEWLLKRGVFDPGEG
jgi:50S ribosomal protein L16 3-hydroxylase